MSFAGVILGAGAGLRMGGPKALLAVRWGDGPGELPLAIAHARALLDDGAERVVLVTRGSVARELAPFAQRGIDVVVSDVEAALGPAGSLRWALDAMGDEVPERLLVTPVDVPPSSHSVRHALGKALDSDIAALAARPVFEGRNGHPVLIRRTALTPFHAEVPPPLREVLQSLGDACLGVPVDDRRAIIDLNEPKDVIDWYKTPPRFFRREDD